MESCIQICANWATVIGLLIVVGGFYFTIKQLKQYKKTEESRFWIELRTLFREHDEVHYRLRNPEDWGNPKNGPESSDEWAMVESYMGTCEMCYHMIDKGLIELEVFKNQYGYRIGNIVHNEKIRGKKLKTNGKYWRDFLNLMKKLDIPLPEN